MSKPKSPPKQAENEARAVLRTLRTSPQKLNLVAESIRGLTAEHAVNELRFSRKRIAKDVLKCLKSAVANAEENHNLDIDSLVVTQAHVGKNITMKRMNTRARGRGARIEKLFSQLTIVVREVEDETKPAKKKAPAKKAAAKKAAPPQKTEKKQAKQREAAEAA